MKIYLAGPDVFREDAIEFGKALKEYVAKAGAEGLFPMDNEVQEKLRGEVIAFQIFQGNVAMIDRADIVIANIEPFRGPGLDAGTAWEIGYAFAKGKPVYAYSSLADVTYLRRVNHLRSKKGGLSDDLPIVEDFGLYDNLMITNSAVGSIHKTFAGALEAALKDAKEPNGTDAG